MSMTKRIDGDYSIISLTQTAGNADVGFTTILLDANKISVEGITTLNESVLITGGPGEVFSIQDGDTITTFSVDSTTGNTIVAGAFYAGESTLASATIIGNTSVGGTLLSTGLATFTAGADMTGDKIVNVLDPTLPQDAATKAYVDSVSSGGWTATDGVNTSVISGGDAFTFNATANETTIAVSAGLDSITIGLPDDVTIGGILTVTGNSTVGGTLGVTGATALDSTLSAGASTLASAAIAGAATVGTTLGVTGVATFGDDVTLTGALISKSAAVTGISTTATNVDTFDGTVFRSAKYVVQVTNGTDYQTMEALVIHDGTTATLAEYAIIDTNGILGSLSANYNAGTIELQYTGLAAGNDVKVALTVYLEI